MDQQNETGGMEKVFFVLNERELAVLKVVEDIGLASFSNLRGEVLGG